MSENPIKQFVLSVLFQAQKDRATELVIALAKGEESPIKYKVDGTWYDVSKPPSSILPDVMIELGRLANLTVGAKESEICTTFSGVRLKWKITSIVGAGGYVLTPL